MNVHDGGENTMIGACQCRQIQPQGPESTLNVSMKSLFLCLQKGAGNVCKFMHEFTQVVLLFSLAPPPICSSNVFHAFQNDVLPL